MELAECPVIVDTFLDVLETVIVPLELEKYEYSRVCSGQVDVMDVIASLVAKHRDGLNVVDDHLIVVHDYPKVMELVLTMNRGAMCHKCISFDKANVGIAASSYSRFSLMDNSQIDRLLDILSPIRMLRL